MFKKMALKNGAIVSLLIGLWVLVPNVYAKQANDNLTNKSQLSTNTADNSIAEAAKHKFSLQDFQLKGVADLKVEFMYENFNGHFHVKKIHFTNLGNALIVDILEDKHVLGRNDGLSLTVPNVDKILLRIEPYSVGSSSNLYDGEMSVVSKSFLFSKDKNGMYLLDTNE